jgi:O-antigen/teichoic acid export membrane protein
VATAINSGTGFVFWWLAARQFPPAAVGLAGAAVSGMLLLSQISVLGLGTTLAGVLHRERRPASLAMTALVAAAGTGGVLGTAVAIAAPAISSELAPVGADALAVGIFAIGVGMTALSAVLDQVLVAVFRSSYQLTRNIIFSIGRLVLLAPAAALLGQEGMVIFLAWLLGTIVSIAVVAIMPRHRGRIADVVPLQWRRLGDMALGALSHHILNLSRSSSVWLLPVLVTAIVSPEANAGFYMAFLLANFLAIIGSSATFTLYVVGARRPEQLWRQMRFTIGLSAVAACGGTAALALVGEPLLRVFGESYAATAYPTVVILAASALPLAVKDHWIALQRIRGTVARGAFIGVALLAVELTVSAYAAMTAGIAGLAVARLAILLVQAAAMLPSIYRALLPRGSGPLRGAGPDVAGDLPEMAG